MSIEIIPTSVQFADSLHACLSAVAQEKKYIALLEAPAIYYLRSYINENRSLENPLFIAIKNQEVIAWCDIIRDPMPVYSHTGILGMGILKPYRRQGLGKLLLKTSIQSAFDKGIERIELNVFASNIGAISLYQSFGFKQEGRQIKKHFLEGHYQDLIQMALFKADINAFSD